MPRRFPVLLSRCLLLVSILWGTAAGRAADQPSLVVVISIDQFRGDYLTRFRPFFGPAGFNRMLGEGAVFADAHHQHSYTKTGPGHASILTGVHADIHGIIANDWLDHETLARISCVGDDTVSIVGLPASSWPRLPGINDPFMGRSPHNLLAETVGDKLKQQPGSRSRVFGVAGKDRASILMSGRRADAAYFLEWGRMVTSTYYRPALPAWAEQWNGARKADACFGRTWDRLLPAEKYSIQDPDDSEGEDAKAGALGRVFPKKVTGGLPAPGPDFYDALENTPFENDLVADFAETLIREENLGGRDGVTDLLCLGLSANDHAGHLWGPDSQEVMDITLRTDRLLADFFTFLDQRIGLAHCLIILTADHGSCSTPEHIHATHPEIPAGRLDTVRLWSTGEAALNRRFGPLAHDGKWTLRDDAWLVLLPAALQEKHVEPEEARRVLRDALLSLDFIRSAFTRGQLERGDYSDEFGRRALLSFNRQRSGDVFYQTVPYYFSRATGSNHGTPYFYDTHVPLVWFGGGVKAGVHPERVWVSDLAPTLAGILGLPALEKSTGRRLDLGR
jgi:hypothetical protein